MVIEKLLEIFGNWKSFFSFSLTSSFIYYFFDKIIVFFGYCLNAGLTHIAGVTLPNAAIINYTGFASWWMAALCIPEILTVAISAIGTRFALKFIPFIGVRL